MSLLNNFTNLLSQINTIINENTIINIINEMEDKINKLEIENTKLKEDIIVINKELTQKKEEILDFSKVSYFKTINKEITEKNNKIKMLETQLNKYKTKNIHIETKSEDINSIFIKSDTDNKLHIEEYCNETINKPKKLLDEDEDDIKPINDKISNKIKTDEHTLNEKTDTHTLDKKIKTNQHTLSKKIEIDNKIKPDENMLNEKTNNKTLNEKLDENILNEKTDNKIKLDENILNEKTDNKIKPDENILNEKTDNNTLDENIKKKDKKKKPIKTQEDEILEKCDDINGYELLTYKKTYYLRNLETNELHSIINFKPDNIVGYLTTSGKIKFK